MKIKHFIVKMMVGVVTLAGLAGIISLFAYQMTQQIVFGGFIAALFVSTIYFIGDTVCFMLNMEEYR